MIKVAITCNGSYKAVVAAGSDTPYQILAMNHIDPKTKKVFINGKKIGDDRINSPLSVFQPQGGTLFIAVNF